MRTGRGTLSRRGKRGQESALGEFAEADFAAARASWRDGVKRWLETTDHKSQPACEHHHPCEYDGGVNVTIELDREEDGRWIAEALQLPGVMCYGRTRDEAISNAERLAIEVIADRIAHGELPSSSLGVCFTIADEQLARQ